MAKPNKKATRVRRRERKNIDTWTCTYTINFQ